MDSRITLSISGQQTGKKKHDIHTVREFFIGRLGKEIHPSGHIPLAGTQSMAMLNCEKPGGNWFNTVPRRKRFGGLGEHKIWKTALKFRNSRLGYVPSKQRGGGSHHISETSLHLVIMTLDIMSLLPAHLPAPGIRPLPNTCRETDRQSQRCSVHFNRPRPTHDPRRLT